MNIFALSDCPVDSAKQMVDKHVVKMPTETCQMLHTNILYFIFKGVYGVEPSLGDLKSFHTQTESDLMKPAMLNHPSTIWARQSLLNANWLLRHGLALCEEYTHRYGKVHGSQLRIQDAIDWYLHCDDGIFPTMDLTPPTIAMFDQYRLPPEDHTWDFVIKSYRHYYLEGKWRFAVWTGRDRPSWYPKRWTIEQYKKEMRNNND